MDSFRWTRAQDHGGRSLSLVTAGAFAVVVPNIEREIRERAV
jgi:hypothetical protein